MITLLADRPSEAHVEELEQFGRLAGLWETDISFYPPDGSPARSAVGEWEFAYALEGRAVIDVWQVPGRTALSGARRAPYQECGLCVRIWDPRLELWRFTFHGTARGDVIHMFARQMGDEIVLERAEGGQLQRWIFSDIAAESFQWRSKRSGDGGRSWQLEQELRARRTSPPAVPPDPRSDLAAALHAAGAHASHGDAARTFDRFVGTWDTAFTHFAEDGSVRERYSGEVVFGWIIDGWAMQDVWIGEPPEGEKRERSIGTSIRFLDGATGLWNVVWLAPEGGVVATLKGGAVGDRIVLEGESPDGSLRRWSFDDIRPNSFIWRGERSNDGQTWFVTAEYHMTRRIPT